jgi:hypothetical protein
MQFKPRPLSLVIAVCAANFMFSLTVRAQISVWTGIDDNGLWNDAGNWLDGIPNASGVAADLSQFNFTGTQTIHLNTGVTMGDVIFGTTNTTTAVQWTADNNGFSGNILTLSTSVGIPTINVNDPYSLGNNATITAVLAGSRGFTLGGGGTLTLGGVAANTFTGGITISNGTLFIQNTGNDANTSDPLTLGSTIAGSSATLILGSAAFPNPIVLTPGAQSTITISGDPVSKTSAAISGPAVDLNGGSLAFVAVTGATGNSYFANGVTGSGNLTLVQNGSGTLNNNGAYNNSGAVTLQGAGTGSFGLGTLSSNMTTFSYNSSSATINGAPTIFVNNNGTIINSGSTLNLPNTGGIGIGPFGNNLTLNCNSTGNVLINALDYRFGGFIENAGSGTGATTISAGIFNNSGMTMMIQNSATSPLILTGKNFYNVPTLVSNGCLLWNCPLINPTQTGCRITVFTNGILGGTGIRNGLDIIWPGGGLAPGTNDGFTIATLTYSNSASLSGGLLMTNANLFFKVNPGHTQTNDFVQAVSINGVSCFTNITSGNGFSTLFLTNVGPNSISQGETFKLFSTNLVGGANVRISCPSYSGQWINNLAVNGSITAGGPPPDITNVSPTYGSTAGGTVVTITGSNFVSGDIIQFDGASGTGVIVNNSVSITATAPANAPGTVNVTVTPPGGQASTLTNAFTYVLPVPPVITSLSPTNGFIVGSTIVTITGSGFTNGDTVIFGSNAGTGVVINNSTTITSTTPANTVGAVDVSVTDTSGQISTLTNGFYYLNPPDPVITKISPTNGYTTGGTVVTIYGTNFLVGDTVQFGPNAGTGVAINNSTNITATTPSGNAGAANVTVTDVANQTGTLANGFLYVLPPPPVVMALTPSSGPTTGGTVVTVTGTGFANGDTLKFGPNSGVDVTINSSTSITATAPTHAEGEVNVTVTDTSGQSSTLSGGFNYTPTIAMTNPAIVITNMPAFGTYGANCNLSGYVTNANFTTNCLAVFAYWPNENPSPQYDQKLSPWGWFSLPTFSSPLTRINSDGSWSCNMPSNHDQYASEFCVALVPTNWNQPVAEGVPGLITSGINVTKSEAILYVDRVDPYRRQVNWSGYGWWVKTAGADGDEFLGATGPGGNNYSDSTNNVWVDAQDNLHLAITKTNGGWECAQIWCDESLGYGQYSCTLDANIGNLDQNVIFSMFTWSDDDDYVNREIDMEVSYWNGDYGPHTNEDFAISPYAANQVLRFGVPLTTTVSTHTFNWTATNVTFQTLNGGYTPSPASSNILASWTTSAPPLPLEGGEEVTMILWLNASAPANGQPVEVTLSRFQYDPPGLPQPAQISQPQMLPNGTFQFNVQGAPEGHYEILSTSNIMNWPTNGPIIRATNQANVFTSLVPPPPVTFQYTDTNAPAKQASFYNIITEP